ncbi:MAG: molybdopterin molybdotransferase MoeA [Verrucomicrobiaceae bacterium]|nr:molybdopterin molybdotransferase MoeA [Verrucomicrobiaceae bacterium]
MIDESAAIEWILSSTFRSETEEVSIVDAAGRYLLEDIRSRIALPGFDQSSMDGYALCRADLLDGGGKLRISGINAAGIGEPGKLGKGEAMKVYTGAPLPIGADTVVMQEGVRVEDGELIVDEGVELGEYTRRRGVVVCSGQRIAESGQRVEPAEMGLLASQGISSLAVARWPRVAVITTGDELVEPGVSKLGFGQVFNSNAAMLEGAVRNLGIPSVEFQHVGDELHPTLNAIRKATQSADVVLVAGGMSVGGRDKVRQALDQCGVNIEFWRVRIKPGKPFLYASFGKGGQLFGLPGNPVSALVGFLIFVLPALQLRLGSGRGKLGMRCVSAKSLSVISNSGNRPHYVRGVFDDAAGFLAAACQSPQNVLALSQSNALARVPAGKNIGVGDLLEVKLLWDR